MAAVAILKKIEKSPYPYLRSAITLNMRCDKFIHFSSIAKILIGYVGPAVAVWLKLLNDSPLVSNNEVTIRWAHQLVLGWVNGQITSVCNQLSRSTQTVVCWLKQPSLAQRAAKGASFLATDLGICESLLLLLLLLAATYTVGLSPATNTSSSS